MSTTFDKNVLLYASDDQSPRHRTAAEFIDSLTAGPDIVYLLWPVVMGYLRIATHPAIFADPLTPADALANVEAILRRPAVVVAGETERFWDAFVTVAHKVAPRGNLV